MIEVRQPESIYKSSGQIQNGTFTGRWHFSFGPYHDGDYMQFGELRVFNDDTLSPGAIWPLHSHSNIEVVTYCAQGVFRHADQDGIGGTLKEGWVQHTTVGMGMQHSEINDSRNKPMRFIQMWFLPSELNLKPSVEQKPIEKDQRTNQLCLLVSNKDSEGLKMFSDAKVFSLFLQKGKKVNYILHHDRGGYLYVLSGGPIKLNDKVIASLGAAKILEQLDLQMEAIEDSEILFVDTFYQTGV
jgi:quercetin 2,3-dioxygenase